MPDGRTNLPGSEPRPPHSPTYMPSGPNACTTLLCASTTYTVELAPTAMPSGALNCQAPSPEPPHESRYAPPGPNFWTRALPRSVTYTLPSPSTAAAWGFTKLPGSRPDWPQDVENGWLELPAAASAQGAAPPAASRAAAAAAGASRAAAAARAPPRPLRSGVAISARLAAWGILGACQYLSARLSNFLALWAGAAARVRGRRRQEI